MIHSGTRPLKPDHRDFDYFKSKKFGAIPTELPREYFVDAGFWMPNQVTGSESPKVSPQPYGCTNFTSCDVCSDEDRVLYNPDYLEVYTHANAQGGIDVRTSLKAVLKYGMQNFTDKMITLNLHPAYYNIQPSGAIDAFDSVRLAMLSASSEKRGVSIGSPFWLQWGVPGLSGILPTPDFNLEYASWHNWACKGWKTIDNVPYLICKMWCGDGYGDKGFVYMSREIFNATMAVPGSCAFTIDKKMEGEPDTVDMGLIDTIVSYVRRLFNLS